MQVRVGVNPGEDGGLVVFKAESRAGAEGIGHADVASFMREDARSEASGEITPIVVGCSMIRRICGAAAKRGGFCGVLSESGRDRKKKERGRDN